MKKRLLKLTGATILNLLISANALAANCSEKVIDNKKYQGFKSVFSPDCLYTYQDWIRAVWTWSMEVMIPLSALILTAAGILYMTSEGDSGRVGTAKKMIIGVLSGLGLLILSRLLLMVIFGDASIGGWVF